MGRRKLTTVVLLIFFPMLMFGFSYALVPAYHKMCQLFGINGKVTPPTSPMINEVDTSRSVNIQFLTQNYASIPFDFYPEKRKITGHPNEKNTLFFVIKNRSHQKLTVHIGVSVSPGMAASSFKELNAFSGKRYTLGPQQRMRLPLIFYINKTLPKEMHTVSVAYTLFHVKFKGDNHVS